MREKQQQQQRESKIDSRSVSNEKHRNEKVLLELYSQGIMGKKAEQLSQLEWVTAEYIKAHVAKVKADGNGLGLAICRMECHDLIETRDAVEIDRDRYRKGWGLPPTDESDDDEFEDDDESEESEVVNA